MIAISKDNPKVIIKFEAFFGQHFSGEVIDSQDDKYPVGTFKDSWIYTGFEFKQIDK